MLLLVVVSMLLLLGLMKTEEQSQQEPKHMEHFTIQKAQHYIVSCDTVPHPPIE